MSAVFARARGLALATALACGSTACDFDRSGNRKIAAACEANLSEQLPPEGASLKTICPQARKICVLSDYASLDDYIKDGVMTRPAGYDPSSCRIYTHRNDDAINEIIAIPASGCPFFLDKRRRVFDGEEEFRGDCFEPSAYSIARNARGYQIFRKGGK